MNDVKERLKKMTVDSMMLADESKVTDGARFVEDLGADTLDKVELIISVEEDFGIDFTDADADSVVTFGDLVKIVESKLK